MHEKKSGASGAWSWWDKVHSSHASIKIRCIIFNQIVNLVVLTSRVRPKSNQIMNVGEALGNIFFTNSGFSRRYVYFSLSKRKL